jgi:uncharacterized protein DUF4154
MGHRWSIRGLATPAVLRGRGAVGAALVILSWMTACPNLCRAQKEVPLEYRVKATFLYNFTKFEDAALKVTIVGEDPFGPVLDELASSAPNHGRKLVIERRNWNQDLRRCHVLFISRSEKRHLNAILSNIKGASILTVSDLEQFSAAGGMIGFVFDGEQVRFEINLNAASQARLEISSRLLTLAASVRQQSVPLAN